MEFEYFSSYGSITDYGWVSFFDFFTKIGVINHEGFNQFKALLQSGVYDMVQLSGCCIVSDLPKRVTRNTRGRLHCETESAIEFKDGYQLFYWNGVCVPERWIMQSAQITKDEILKETNAEKRRCLREILGVDRYFELLGGVNIVDKDVDENGNEMVLYESKMVDDIINTKIRFLQVICPSTKRQYILYPPNQKSINVWAAKASTFQDKQIMYRHGDVGILNVNRAYARPVVET